MSTPNRTAPVERMQGDDPRPMEGAASRLERLLFAHLKHVEAFTRWSQKQSPRFQVVDLTPAKPFAVPHDVSEADPVQGIGVINLNAVAISVGWPGNRAVNGQGVSVAAGGYLRIPVKTNFVDVAAPNGFGGATQLPVFIFLYDWPPELAAGSLTGSGSGSGGTTTAAAVTGASPRSVAVGVASALALAANAGRKGSSWVNTGTTTISLGLGATAIAGDDIVLAPNGSWDGMVGPALWTGLVNAISSAAGGTLSVVEV